MKACFLCKVWTESLDKLTLNEHMYILKLLLLHYNQKDFENHDIVVTTNLKG